MREWKQRRRLLRDAMQLRGSPLFDAAWYQTRYPEAQTSGLDPVLHYLLVGAREGFDPGPAFCTDDYNTANPDVAVAGLNPLAHYLSHGRAELRPLVADLTRTEVTRAPAMPAPRPNPRPRDARARLQHVLRHMLQPMLRSLRRPVRILQPVEPDGFGDTAPLRASDGHPPTGWTIVRVPSDTPGARVDAPALDAPVSDAPNARLALRVWRGGDLLEMPLPSSAGSALMRLPDSPARLGLGCGVRSGLRPGQDGVPDRIEMREIGRAEALVRLLRAHGWGLGEIWRALRGPGPGLGAALRGLAAQHAPIELKDYQQWVDIFDTPSRQQIAAMRARVQAMGQTPRFSVIVPVYNAAAPALREMIASVRGQLYPHWELCVADDASTKPHVRAILDEAAGKDQRIRLALRDTNGNISAASNSALALATGEYVALLDHDDVMAPHALLLMAEAILAHPDADVLYSDEDKLNADGERYGAYFKPDFNRELMEGQNIVSHLGVYRLSTLRKIGGFREGYEGSQDYDLALRMTAITRGPIVHVPHILYHWRVFTGADTFSMKQVSRAKVAARRAIEEQAASLGETVKAVDGVADYHRVVRPAPAEWPLVSVIVPTRDHVEVLRECVDGLLDATDYPALEVIIVDNGSTQPRALAYLKRIAMHGVRVLSYPGPFNYSAINNFGAKQANGEILLLLNNDVSMTDPSWLREMVQLVIRPGIGAVGARLLYPDGTLQHGGVVLGLGGAAGHSHVGATSNDPGYFGQLMMTREVSAVTGACLAVRRAAFEEVGGLDEVNLPVAFNDVDFCLRLREAGWRILWTPYAELTHHESKSRGSDFTPERVDQFHAEVAYMLRRWNKQLQSDPFFNPNLSLTHSRPTPAFPPRVPRPWATSAVAAPPPVTSPSSQAETVL